MAKPRTPTNILEAKGAFDRHPDRRRERENEPQVTEPIGDPPEFRTPEELQAWIDIVTWCPKGVLFQPDRIAVERMARILALDRQGRASDAQGRALDALLGKFAMTPADRSKVQVHKPKESTESKWEGIG